MQAETIAIGSELLGAERVDTDSLYLTRALAALGIEVVRKTVVPDDEAAIAGAMREGLARVPLVLCSGGLGPTEDDRTRAAAARALGRRLVRDPAAVARLRARFHRRRRPMPDINLRQADRLQAAEWLPNALGSAPGQWCAARGRILVLLPGPPRELQHVFTTGVRPRLLARARSTAFASRVLSIVGMTESEVDAVAAPIYSACSNPRTTILSTGGYQIELHFQARGPTPARARALADRLARPVAAALGAAVFSRRQQSLAAVVGAALQARRQTVAVAESCTGGMLGAWLTQVPGASRYFRGGVVAYANPVKQALLGVRATTLRRQGAVSAACACEMARGVREKLGTHWGLAITGIAGPGGGTASKPLGTVFIGVSRRRRPAYALAFRFFGDREQIRRASVQFALNELRLRLLG